MINRPRFHIITHSIVDDHGINHSVRLIFHLTLAGIVISFVTALGLWLVGAPLIIILLLVPLGLVGIVMIISTRSLHSQLIKVNQRIIYFEEENQALAQQYSRLEHSGTKKIEDLERQVYLLQTVIEIMKIWDSSYFRSMRDIDQILTESTTIINKRLGLTAVNIFMIGPDIVMGDDEQDECLWLRAASTENGRRLVEAGYSVSLFQKNSISTAGRTRLPFFSGDHLTNPHLVTIESESIQGEFALPLIHDARLLGVLDLQASSTCPLICEDQEVLQVLAEQFSRLINNALTAEVSPRSAQEPDQDNIGSGRTAENNQLHNQPERSFCANSTGYPTVVNDGWHPLMVEACTRGEVVFGDPVEEGFTLAVPVKIRDQVAGVVRLRKPPEGGEWRPKEVALVVRLSDRLSAALESARLFGETRRAAEREHLTSEITTRLRSTNDPQMVLQIAARELRKALRADKAQLRVQSDAVRLSKVDQACSPDQAGDQL